VSFSIKNGDSEVTGDFSRLNKLIEELGKDYYVDIGILGESNETEEGGKTLAGIGAVHEFGTDKAGRGNSVSIPERSFIRMPLESGQKAIEEKIEPKMQSHIEQGNIKGIFKLIGMAGEERIQEAFETRGFGTWPPNAPATIKAKGSDAPLIDDGDLKKAIMSKVGE
jgi:hypothetical protein